ncbi:winged helix DNA-binding protein [Novosphingobium sp.]|uniref:winged helix DNA-binding protein n=1 Tax=Novosphingobium sp. TaxID=1874826 RepID=UPI0026184914|nr:winged helix DNA-binding protein [Novosphingobium sp.]
MSAPEPPSAAYQTDPASAVSLAVFIGRPHLRDQVCEDAVLAGYRVTEVGTPDSFAGQDRPSAAAVVLIDVPAPNAAVLAALARQDVAARERGSQLIVATSLDALEAVFDCLDQSQPQLLVDPGPADLALALGRALALSGRDRLRDLATGDRQLLLRLVEQVSLIAARLERLEQDRERGRADRFEAPALAFRGADEPLVLGTARSRRERLPDPRQVRRILRQRQQRATFLGADLFADPAWDMLLDLTAARGEGKRVSVTSLCIAAGVPATTALRWIAQMTEVGLFVRIQDQTDRRRAIIDLSDKAAAGMAAYFATIAKEGGLVV